jgi:hypothetical protein
MPGQDIHLAHDGQLKGNEVIIQLVTTVTEIITEMSEGVGTYKHLIFYFKNLAASWLVLLCCNPAQCP